MENQVKICPHCQTINEPDYVYCKRCGAALPNTGPNPQAGAPYAPYGPQPVYGQQGGGYGYSVPATIDGVPAEQVDAYIGNNPGLKQKIRKMELTRSKTSWNWPVFLTTFFGGVLLTPCWFFHRKMNKVAAILLIAGIIFTALSLLAMAPVFQASLDMVRDFVDLEQAVNDPYSSWFIDYDQAAEQILLDYMQRISGSLALSSLFNLVQLAYAIIMSLFANYIYKKHVTSTISSMASTGVVTADWLAAKGGTSAVGWIILGAAVLVAVMVLVIFIFQYLFTNILSYVNAVQ